MKSWFNIAVSLCVLAGAALSARAQTAVPPPMAAYQPLSYQQLDQLLGPIALYPDPLIAQILPASTVPTQIVLADRYISGGGDPNQLGQHAWDAAVQDPSVQALARYPSVLKWMDDNLNWTEAVGQAFLNQQQDVMDSIQRLRHSALNVGNLQSTPQQQVIDDGGYIEIVPADPQVIYVPVYQPDQVYYQTCYGPPFISFGIGFPIGLWLNFDFDWWHHHIIVWGHNNPRPPDWWHVQHHDRDTGHTTVWHPHNNYPVARGANRGDRGYVVPRNPTVVTTIGRSGSGTALPRQMPAAAARPAPAAVERFQSVNRPEATGAFIGIQSSRDTRTYSERGQQSMQTVTRSEPVSRPAPAPSYGGGGGGGHSSSPQPRH
ncbi:MAG: DUF3300 domain-containing protein [Limisphaerales bacterium]